MHCEKGISRLRYTPLEMTCVSMSVNSYYSMKEFTVFDKAISYSVMYRNDTSVLSSSRMRGSRLLK